eukprot:190732-Chlamydomonas_euryale.AAC.3
MMCGAQDVAAEQIRSSEEGPCISKGGCSSEAGAARRSDRGGPGQAPCREHASPGSDLQDGGGQKHKGCCPMCYANPQGVLITGNSRVRKAASGRQTDTYVAEGYGRPPDLEEVHACMLTLHSHAAPSGGGHLSERRPADSPIAAQGHMPCMEVGQCTTE